MGNSGTPLDNCSKSRNPVNALALGLSSIINGSGTTSGATSSATSAIAACARGCSAIFANGELKSTPALFSKSSIG